MTITLYIGDTNQELADTAVASDPMAFLIDSNNYVDFLSTKFDHDVTGYTALGELPKELEIFYNILLTADQLVYCPPAQWSDSATVSTIDPTKSIQGLTENMLLLVAYQVPVVNIELAYLKLNPVPLVGLRKSENSQVWCIGASVPNGAGVLPNQRFGQVIADALKMECTFLTKNASSMIWAADQILRSDIRPNDIVIWGLTVPDRLPVIYRSKLLNVTATTYERHPNLENILSKSELYSQNTFYHSMYAVEQVINFCNKCQAQLILFDPVISPNLLRYLKTKTNYINFPYKFQSPNNLTLPKYIDFSSDNTHPGIKQHKQYADFILKHI